MKFGVSKRPRINTGAAIFLSVVTLVTGFVLLNPPASQVQAYLQQRVSTSIATPLPPSASAPLAPNGLPSLFGQSRLRKTLESITAREPKLPAFIDVILVIHAASLTERRKYLDEYFASRGLGAAVHYLTEYSSHDIEGTDLVKQYYKPTKSEWMRRMNATLELPLEELEESVSFKKLTTNEISLVMKHILAWEAVAEISWISRALIIEDDVIFDTETSVQNISDFAKQISRKDALSPWALFPGSGNSDMDMFGLIPYSRNLELQTLHRTVFSDTYLINKAAGRILYTVLPPFMLPVDWGLNWALKHNVTTFWSKPRVTHQGSGTEYNSSLDHTDVLTG